MTIDSNTTELSPPSRRLGRALEPWTRRLFAARAQLTRARARLRAERARVGAKWSVAALALPLVAFGVLHFGPRAGLVVLSSVGACLAANVAQRRLSGESSRALNPGTVVTGLLLGLTLSADTPLYMIPVGAVAAEILGKLALPGLGRSLLNPAAFGRGAIAILETLDPVLLPDVITSASPLMVVSGGHGPPNLLLELLLGLTKGAIGETNKLLLLVVGVPLLGLVTVKRDAALALVVSVPLWVTLLPTTTAIEGHAPWASNPLVYLFGGSTLMMAFFFCTDPKTTPSTRLGGWIFGAGAGLIGVLGRLYTTIPGCEMWGVLVMNAATPGIDWAVARLEARPSAPRTAIVVASPAVVPAHASNATPATPAAPTLRREVRLVETSAVSCELGALRAGFEGEPPFTVLREILVSALPGEIWREVQRSKLTGRGGAHFPVATKWQAARKHAGPRRLVVNGQEGEPETFKDHVLMLREPHLVVEGAAIAAFALDAERVHIVVDPHAEREHAAMARALADLVEAFGADAAARFELVRGPGRYVAGEESALLEHLEGRRVEPRLRPPFPAEKGLFGRPTVIHNVETVSWLPSIVRGGGDAFAARGPLLLVSLSGSVARPGVHAVPIGTTLQQLLALGGGVAPGKSLLAFGVGGPAGGLLPASAAATALRDADLAAAGALLGTGAVRVFDTSQCLVHEVLETLAFFERESCGRCAPCRVGTQVMRRAWADVAVSGPQSELLRRIDATGAALVGGSFCGLGRGVPKRLESLRRHWPELVARHGEGKEACPTCRSVR